MNYKRFDRHEVFEMNDTSFVMECIYVTRLILADGGAELTNMLFGLFDGYYYDAIHKLARLHLPVEMFEKLEDILCKIELNN